MTQPAATPAHLAATAARLVKRDQCDTRAFDDCFEQGNGDRVVAAFMRLYLKDAELRQAVQRNSFYINLEAWKATACRVEAPLLA